MKSGDAQITNDSVFEFTDNYPEAGGLVPGAGAFPLDPRDIETPNDDKENGDEDNDPRALSFYDGSLYSFDGPSFTIAAGTDTAFIVARANFVEWTRVKSADRAADFDNKNLEVEGSRCSSTVPWYIQNYARRGTDGKFVDDTTLLSNSTPVFTGTGTKGTIEITLNSSATTEGFTATYATTGTTWTLTRKSDGQTFSKGGASPWTIVVAGTATVKITEDVTTPFANADKYTFSIFKSTSSIGKS